VQENVGGVSAEVVSLHVLGTADSNNNNKGAADNIQRNAVYSLVEE
jgi:hypothetical protein